MISKDLSAAILAGGRSSRFGSSKFMARFDSKNLIEISLEIAHQISGQIIVLQGQQEMNLPGDIAVYPDKIPDKGPVGGIYTALVSAPTVWVAVLPVDMPLISPIVYKQMFKQKQSDRPVVAVSPNGLEPLVSIWPVTVADILKSNISANTLSLWRILADLNAVRLDVRQHCPEVPAECFFNINTREDLASLEKIDSMLNDSENKK